MLSSVAAGAWSGSSPLTRRKPRGRQRPRRLPGLIPAHAGKTCAPPSPPGSAPAHPRSRGENGGRHGSGDLQAGSSPLTRGKRLLSRLRGLLSRLIPAHAGKTHSEGVGGAGPSAHPRSRGENVQWPTNSITRMGSSPLTRGKLHAWYRAHLSTGLIPAHAGKTVLATPR